jgi:uncharacterized membrane protein
MANMGNMDPRFSVGGGLLATIAGLRRGGLPGMLMAGLGAALLYRGGKEMMGGGGMESAKSPAWMRSTVTIERDPMELYSYWRDFSNLARFMRYIEEVRPVMGGDRSHWVADVPMAGRIEWDSEVTSDVPGERIGWRSVEGSEIETEGEVRFRNSMRGTEVEVEMYYKPPGTAGAVAAKLAKGITESMLREDLKRFKSIMETGEAPTASMTQ